MQCGRSQGAFERERRVEATPRGGQDGGQIGCDGLQWHRGVDETAQGRLCRQGRAAHDLGQARPCLHRAEERVAAQAKCQGLASRLEAAGGHHPKWRSVTVSESPPHDNVGEKTVQVACALGVQIDGEVRRHRRPPERPQVLRREAAARDGDLMGLALVPAHGPRLQVHRDRDLGAEAQVGGRRGSEVARQSRPRVRLGQFDAGLAERGAPPAKALGVVRQRGEHDTALRRLGATRQRELELAAPLQRQRRQGPPEDGHVETARPHGQRAGGMPVEGRARRRVDAGHDDRQRAACFEPRDELGGHRGLEGDGPRPQGQAQRRIEGPGGQAGH